MRYTIENKKIAVTVDSLGAELVSLKTKADDCEYVWQGDPTYWTGHAYNLFPICGRLTDGKYTYKGETYEMNLHGFARKTEYEMVEQTEKCQNGRTRQKKDRRITLEFKCNTPVKSGISFIFHCRVIKEDLHRNSPLLTFLYNILRPMGFSVPEGKHAISILYDGDVPFKWCSPAEPVIIGLELGQLQSVAFRVLSSTGVDTSCSTRYDLFCFCR